MSDVFISHAHATAGLARAAAEALRTLGYTVWLDDDLPAHRGFTQEIETQLMAAKAALVIWSSDAASSDWVLSEANRAREDRKLVQVNVDGARLPMPFDRIQCADLANWAGDPGHPGWRKALASIAELAGETGRPPTTAAPAANPQFALPDKPSIAVLPFADPAGAAEGDYFADGMVDEVVTVLAKFPALFVIGSNSSLTYRGREHETAKIGRELGVRYLLAGSVRRSGPRVRIAVTLVEAEGGEQVWADRFDGTLEDVFALQDEVANAVAARIEPSIQAADLRRGAARPTEDLSAYDLFLRGRARYLEMDPESWRAAEALWEQAVERDPGYALAWAHIAMCETVSRVYGLPQDPGASRRKAEAAIHRATAGADDARVLALIAQASITLGGDPAGCEATAQRALALNPGSANIWVAAAVVANLSGHPERGLERLQHALRLDPRTPGRPSVEAAIGFALVLLGRYDEALPWLEASFTLRPNNPPCCYFLAHAYAELGRTDDARAMLARAQTFVPVDKYLAASSTIPGLSKHFERRREIFRDLGAQV